MFAGGWDDGLDDAQLAAAVHGDGPLVIVAGAGTGKTRALTARVAHLLDRGTPPERILLLTFTRRAADDMLARAGALAGVGDRRPGGQLRGGTFHAVGHQVVSAWAGALGLSSGFSVIDPADAADVMDLLRDEHGLAGTRERAPTASTLVDLYSRCVNTCRPLSEVVPAWYPWCQPHLDAIARLFKAYVARKRHHCQLDFDDLLLYWRAALLDSRIGAELRQMFDHVLVDEYQDVNSLQVDIVRQLCPTGRGLTVVGDDAQAIYGFRGAEAKHLLRLATELPGATVLRLERNFRSVQPVLDVANAVRPPAPVPAAVLTPSGPGPLPAGATGLRLRLSAARPGGRRPVLVSCYDAACEARAVVDRILERHDAGMPFQDQAVLERAAHHTDLIEMELTLRRVPYRKYGGLRFVEAAHVKDFAAAARLLDNPADDLAWFRLVRLHDAVGPARARALLGTLPPRCPQAVHDWSETVAAAPPAARAALDRTLQALAAARAVRGAGEQAERVLQLLSPLVSARYRASAARLGDLQRLCSAARSAQFAGQSLSAWVAQLALDPPASSSDFAGPPVLDDDFVVISTVHSAKGLEWPVVHLVHLVDGAFPSDMALGSADGLDEERRLFYVAVTRARDELLLYTPLRMPHHRFGRDDRHSLAPQSRFLDCEVLRLLHTEEQPPTAGTLATALAGSAQPAGTRTGAPAAASVAAELDNLWD
jgi:DNA helicase-2/ATP-dependent DNA helicase PcrA